jgi:hypothetical protein
VARNEVKFHELGVPPGLELAQLDARVGEDERDRLADHVGEALVEVLPELDRPGADDRDRAAQSAHMFFPHVDRGRDGCGGPR